MAGNLWEKDNYTANITHLINTDINVYDMKSANISILKNDNLLTDEEYIKLMMLPKMQREIEIGLLSISRPEVKQSLSDGFIKYRRLLFEDNDIEDYSVLSIKKDAVYLINRTLSKTQYGNVYFREDGSYTSFYRLPNLELFFKYPDTLEVKGINDNILNLYHKDYFSSLLCFIFQKAEREEKDILIKDLRFIIEQYLSFELEPECYREFNRNSSFRFKPHYNIYGSGYDFGTTILTKELVDNFKEYIDISYNYSILMHLYSYYLNSYIGQV